MSEVPEYYQAVMTGAKSVLFGYGLASYSGREAVDQFRKLQEGGTPDKPTDEVKFLDTKGAVTTDTRQAVAALVTGTSPAAHLFFSEQFCQPASKEPRPVQVPSLQDIASSGTDCL